MADELSFLRSLVDDLRMRLRDVEEHIASPAAIVRVKNDSGHSIAYATPGSLGLDLRACCGVERQIPPGRRFMFDSGIAVQIPDGFGGLVLPRSGLARDHGVVAVTGLIDCDYRGRIGVNLVNLGSEPYTVLPGDRIAQLVILPMGQSLAVSVDELGPTERGSSGFGSSGR